MTQPNAPKSNMRDAFKAARMFQEAAERRARIAPLAKFLESHAQTLLADMQEHIEKAKTEKNAGSRMTFDQFFDKQLNAADIREILACDGLQKIIEICKKPEIDISFAVSLSTYKREQSVQLSFDFNEPFSKSAFHIDNERRTLNAFLKKHQIKIAGADVLETKAPVKLVRKIDLRHNSGGKS